MADPNEAHLDNGDGAGAGNDANDANAGHGDEIAVIGMVCRLPGANSICDYWDNIRDGVESISFFTDEELRAEGVDPELLDNPAYVKSGGGHIDGIDMFDAAFFGFAPREAEVMDPQHRLFLEAAHEALETAGYDPETYPGAIGVFAGAGRPNYLLENLLSNPRLLESVGAVQATLGSDKDFVPTRTSYVLDLKGPSINVQTACSTSLVATHLACQSLITGESDIAMAGGVSITSTSKTGYLYEEGGIYSPDGRCRSFDADAKGMVGANGLAIVVLKRLADALEDGDTVHGVILGSAMNNDGALRVGFTAPGVDGQAQAISDALAVAGVDARTVTYVEADGTGTPLGDPIEVAALTQAFRGHTEESGFCALGSVKSNIGHTNAAAGAAGLIKAVLALEHRTLPKSLNFERPSPEIDFASSPFFVNTETRPWEAGSFPRRAGVTSIGMGGTNTHLILQEPPPLPPTSPSRSEQLIVLSAKSSTALEMASANLAEHLKSHPDVDLADVAFTLQTGRRGLNHRRMLVAGDAATAAEALDRLDTKRVLTSVRGEAEPPVAFMFPGQGAQYTDMGRQLYDGERGFRERVDACAEILKPQLEIDLRDALYPAKASDEARDRLDQTWLTQPAIFVIEYALARLWMDWGVHPRALVGHSVGEYVAACLANVLSLEDALTLVATRGRMMQDLPGGDMLSVPLPEEDVTQMLGDDLSLSAVNGPSLCVVSGPPPAVQRLQQQLADQEMPCRILHTSHAFHSAMLDPIIEPFREVVAKVSLSPAAIPCVSTVTGAWIQPDDWCDPTYWARNLRQPVRFSDAATKLLANPDRLLLEVGPGQTLSELVRHHSAPAMSQATVPSLRHPHQEQSDVEFLLTSLGRMWLAGVQIDWPAVWGDERRRRIELPTYPFEKKRYWVAPARETGVRSHQAAPKQADIGTWFYLPMWKQSVVPPMPRRIDASPDTSWLIFLDEAGLCASVAAHLAKATGATSGEGNGTGEAQRIVCVEPGESFEKIRDDHYRIRTNTRDDYDALIAELRDSGHPPGHIVHGWSITAGAESSLDEWQERGFYSLLFLAQALGDQLTTLPVQIDFLSNDLHEVLGGETTDPQRATALGPCLVIPREYDDISCRNIDVRLGQRQPAEMNRVAALVLAECLEPAVDPVVAYRGSLRCVPSYDRVRLEKPSNGATALRDGATYLITGGLGGVGLALAELFAESASAKLVLLSKSGLPARELWDSWLGEHDEDDRTSRRIRKVMSLEQRGAEVLVLAGDVADEEQMRSALALGRERFGPISGVVHAAGLATGGMIGMRTADDAARVMSPKLEGTLALRDLLADDPLDFFVLCSSLASVMGGVGAVDYCGANAFLDALAHTDDPAHPTPFVTVGWDTWAEVGMAVETEVPEEIRREREEFLRKGILSTEGKDVLERILSHPVRHVLISTHDLPTRLEPVPEPAADTGEDAEETSVVVDPATGHMRPDLPNPYVAPETELQRSIAAVWQELLGVDRVGIHDNFFELGGHSLAGTRVAARLRQTFEVDVALRQLFEAPTVAELAQHVEATRWASDAEPPAGTAGGDDREEIEI